MMKYILPFLMSFSAFAALSDVDRQEFWSKNLLKNGGAENGKGSGIHKWTASAGTFATVTSGSNLLTGRVSFTWDAAASTNTLSYGAVTIPNGLKGKNGVALCKIMTPSGTATHSLQAYDGSSVLGSITIASSTSPQYQYASFIFPSSGTIILRLLANQNEPSITIDDCWLGDAEEINLTNISQTTFIGNAFIDTTASCQWNRTSTTLGPFGTVAACPGPTVGSNPGPGIIQTTDADLPRFTVNNLPPGRYRVVITGSGGAAVATGSTAYAITDGSVTVGRGYGNATNASTSEVMVESFFEYTSSGNRTFELYTSAVTGTRSDLYAQTGNLRVDFSIIKYPLSTELAYKPSTSALSWSGYHDITCSWARTNTAIGDPAADASCSLVERTNTNFGTVSATGSVLPQLLLIPSRIGKYFVCVNFRFLTSSGGADSVFSLNTSSVTIAEAQGDQETSLVNQNLNLCGIWNITSLAAQTLRLQWASSAGSTTLSGVSPGVSTLEWSIFAIDQALPSPVLVHSVASSYSGVTAIEVAQLNCDASSSIISQHGSWVSSIGNISAGTCAITLSAGAFSSTPYCQMTLAQSVSSDGLIGITASSATSLTTDCFSGVNCTTYDFNLTCIGAK